MSFLNIQSALAQRLNSVTGLPTVYWGGVDNTPASGTPWVRPTLIPFESEIETMTGTQRNTGIYQVALFMPLDRGEGPLLTLMDTIKQHFKAQQRLSESGTNVLVLAVSIARPVRVEAWMQGNVEIRYISIESS